MNTFLQQETPNDGQINSQTVDHDFPELVFNQSSKQVSRAFVSLAKQAPDFDKE